MPRKIPAQPFEKPGKGKPPDIKPVDPEEPLIIPAEDPDIIPDEETPETVPYEEPAPGEGP